MKEFVESLDENLVYHDHQVHTDHIDIFVHSNRESVLCPLCGQSSSRIHSRYQRTFQDLPIQGKQVHIHVLNRKYICSHSECTRKIFAEPLNCVKSNSQKSERLLDEITKVALEASSVTASGLLRDVGVAVGKSSICTILKKRIKLVDKDTCGAGPH